MSLGTASIWQGCQDRTAKANFLSRAHEKQQTTRRAFRRTLITSRGCFGDARGRCEKNDTQCFNSLQGALSRLSALFSRRYFQPVCIMFITLVDIRLRGAHYGKITRGVRYTLMHLPSHTHVTGTRALFHIYISKK
jgi:hypothetical protein